MKFCELFLDLKRAWNWLESKDMMFHMTPHYCERMTGSPLQPLIPQAAQPVSLKKQKWEDDDEKEKVSATEDY